MSESENDQPSGIQDAMKILSSVVPFITSENWIEMNENGWRFEESHTPKNLKAFVKHYQDTFGAEEVALGWMFPKASEFPVEDDIITGIYIRDGAVQATVLHDMLDDDEMFAGVRRQWSDAYNGKKR